MPSAAEAGFFAQRAGGTTLSRALPGSCCAPGHAFDTEAVEIRSTEQPGAAVPT